MRSELGESFDHFLQAATHAAGGMGATVGPRLMMARQRVTPGFSRVRTATSSSWAAFTPVMEAAREGAASAIRAAERAKAAGKAMSRGDKGVRGMSRRRSGLLIGLVAAGAAGAAGVVVIRRRNKARWEQYEAEAVEPIAEEAIATLEQAQQARSSATEKLATGAGKAADKVNDWAASAKSAASDWSESAQRAAKPAGSQSGQQPSQSGQAEELSDLGTVRGGPLGDKSTPAKNNPS